MPIYEYRCTKCDIPFEKLQTMLENHIADCPECGSSKTIRIFSIPATKVINDAELSQRMIGVPKQRIERTKDLINEKIKRKKNPQSEKELISNELHLSNPNRRK